MSGSHHQKRRRPLPGLLLCCLLSAWGTFAAEPAPRWSLLDALNQALTNNPALRQAALDLKANQGIVLQTRAVVFPRLETVGKYDEYDPALIDRTIEEFVPVVQTEH